ncbi:hypothetical protein Q73_06760 [Bacillus coahuilensis m2-6]|uniref:hypothetical protein n=1 Tax=Bacillus coahuilensis TaxID=408580 RepID=UPI0001850FF0|nr:hypothetical protein [Bacillus coahuilensis]KUP08216.1 hypothetical protein Q73_06760 [Bacillus coahuilensis m2-6]
MNVPEDQNHLGRWESVLKGLLLDPFTNYLDEQLFRIDLYDTTDKYIIEVLTENLDIDEIEITKEGKLLAIQLMIQGEGTHRLRKVPFPFDLKFHQVEAIKYRHWFEISINKEAIKSNVNQSIIRIQGE